ncbi:MAG: hypothetical protein ACTSPY_02000 [Candidatus Helarchaeota archaeon]
MVQNRGIIGHLEWRDGVPAKNIKIAVTEKDMLIDDILPSTKTDDDGNFIITYNPDKYTVKGIFKEKPDIEIIFEYKKNNIPKKVKLYYKNVVSEWLVLDNIKLDDPSAECCPIEEEEKIPYKEHTFIVNLNDHIDIKNIKNNKIWEVYIGSILEFSQKSIIPEHTPLKINSWGGKAIVADVINEGSISKEEKKLNEKSIELLKMRHAKFEEMTLLFNWIDKDGNIIHDSLYNASNTNHMKIIDISIFIPKPTSRTEAPEFLPVDRLEIKCRIIVEGKLIEFEIISMDSIQNLIL